MIVPFATGSDTPKIFIRPITAVSMLEIRRFHSLGLPSPPASLPVPNVFFTNVKSSLASGSRGVIQYVDVGEVWGL